MSSTLLINQAVAEQRHASEQQPSAKSCSKSDCQNVGSTERQMSLVAGAVLAGLGLSRGGLSGLAMMGMGGALAYRGATGYCSVYEALGIDSTE